jgi:uncharacterized protein (TIGR02677 family)
VSEEQLDLGMKGRTGAQLKMRAASALAPARQEAPSSTDAPPAHEPSAANTTTTRSRAGGPRELVLPFETTREFRYISGDRADLLGPVVDICFHNKRSLGLRLSLGEIHAELAERYGVARELVALRRDLDWLYNHGNIDKQVEGGLVGSIEEYRQGRFTFDITARGEQAHQAVVEFLAFQETAVALEASRLPAILEALLELAGELRKERPDPGRLYNLLDSLLGLGRALRQSISDFMSGLSRVLSSTEAVNSEGFQEYKREVARYLREFNHIFELRSAEIAAVIAEVDELGAERMVELAARADHSVQLDMTADEIARSRETRPREAWTAMHAWFLGDDERAPQHQFRQALMSAITWITETALRLAEQRTGRVDRTAEYRALARWFNRLASDAECHALFHASFGLWGPRHHSGAWDDPEQVSEHERWLDAPPAPVEPYFFRPGGRAPGAGRGTSLPDLAETETAFAEQCAAEREELRRAMSRFAGNGPIRLTDLAELDDTEFTHLLNWLSTGLATPSADGEHRCTSADGLVQLVLRLPADPTERADVWVGEHRFEGPNLLLEVRAT